MRRQRCETHDVLFDGHCPECRVEILESEVARYKEALALWGDPVKVHVSYTWRDVFEKVLRAFSYPGTDWGSPTVLVGKAANRESNSRPMPRAVAEKLAEAAKDMDAEYQKAMKKGYEDGVRLLTRIVGAEFIKRFTKSMTEALEDATSEFDKEQKYSLSSALEDAVKKAMAKEEEEE